MPDRNYRLLLPALILLGLTLCPSPALAGTYTVAACGKTGLAEGWSAADGEPAHLETALSCPAEAPNQTSGLYVTTVLGAGSTAPNAAAGSWSFSVPAGLTIVSWSVVAGLGRVAPETEWHPELRTGTGAVLAECGEFTGACGPGEATYSGLSTNKLEIVLRCVVVPPSSGCRDGATEHQAHATLYGSEVAIEDPTPPALSDVAGAFWAAHYASGSLPATFAASDRLGVRRALLSVDGGAASSVEDYSCAEDEFSLGVYTKVEPCADVPEGTLSLDTTKLSDGPHTVKLTVEDPAGNVASTEHAIVVDNHGPAAPEELMAEETSPATLGYHVTWRDPSAPAAPIVQARLRLCPGTGATCTTPQEVSGTSADLAVPSPGSWTVEVQLVDEAGKAGPFGSTFIEVPQPSGPATMSTETTTTTQSAVTTTTTRTTSSHTSTTTLPAISASGVVEGRRLVVTATVRHPHGGAVAISAYVRRDGRRVESCKSTVALKAGVARVAFRLRRAALRGVIVVRARYGTAVAVTRARRIKPTRRLTALARTAAGACESR